MNARADQLRQKLGLTKATQVEWNLDRVITFFDFQLRLDPLDAKWLSYLAGIDYSKPVADHDFVHGQRLSRHLPRDAREKPFLYFTDPGTSPFNTGTSFPESSFEVYEVNAAFKGLKAYCSTISFRPRPGEAATDFHRVSRNGGGVQYIIAQRDFAKLALMRKSEMQSR